MDTSELDNLLQHVRAWPEADRNELFEVARDIEARRTGTYRASDDELKAIDDADRSGVATEREVAEALSTFRRA